MSIYKNWKIKDNVISDEVLQACDGNRVLAVLLANRGIDNKNKIEKFLNPLKVKLLSPDVFNQSEKAALRIKQAVDNNEHITVYGDFDADGITSTALMYLTLKEIGADVDYYLPDRNSESHGLNTKAIVNIIAKKKTRLIITVDCGISNVAEVKFAKGLKTDIIITDHHEAPEILPDAYAIINAKAKDNLDPSLNVDDISSLNYLAGVGVAFKLSCKMLALYNKESFVHELLPLAAIGTIGDVVELIGENRTIVSMGLELIKDGKNKGLQKLLKSAGIESITSENIAFGIVPRLNAAGRLESANTAIKILISKDDTELDELIKTVNDLNSLRQQLCEDTFNIAEEMYKKDISNNRKSIILFEENWHIGIIGIVASKLVEKYNKPTFLMTKDSNNSNIIKCSCRSIEALDIHYILSQHKDLFEGFGGHKMAAGFSFSENKITFDKFKVLLNQTIEEYSQGIDYSAVSLNADMILSPEEITIETVNAVEKLQPFGAANQSPLFVMENLILNDYKMMGQNSNHLKMFVSMNNSDNFECVKWSCPDFNMPIKSNLDLLFSLKINTFNDKTNLQLIVSDIHSEFLNSQNKKNSIKIIDHREKNNIIMQVVDFINSTKKTTAVYMENLSLLNDLNLPQNIKDKIFTDNIPTNVEQLMFFDAPPTEDYFMKIINETNASIVHLMNFKTTEINTDNVITKLSGMLKYALKNLNGDFNINKLSTALGISVDAVETALSLFENAEMIDLNKIGEFDYKITNINPIELSKVKQNEIFEDMDYKIKEINAFKNFYLTSPVEEIKEKLLC